VPEIEAIATDMLVEIEAEGLAEVIPTARAANLTMNREGIRRLAAEELGLPTSPYAFADSLAELQAAIDGGRHWLPLHRQAGDVLVRQGPVAAARPGRRAGKAWDYAASGGRVNQGRVIVEGFIDFDYEITLLTVRAMVDAERRSRDPFLRADRPRPGFSGDYVESWQPQAMSAGGPAKRARHRQAVTDATSAGAACSASNCSSRATWSGSRKSARARTTPGWSP
jgi:phosphoribosylglycinamide formyltransferase 2